jgi:integrase
MPFRKAGSPYWQYDRTITVAGQRYRLRGSTGARSKPEAREVEEAEVRAARARILHGPAKVVLTLDQAIGTYCANVARHQPSWRTTRSQAKILRAGLGKATPLPDITAATLTEHIARRRAVVSNATVNREIQLLRRVLAYAGKNLAAAVPDIDWRALALREPHERSRELTATEQARLFRHLRTDFHPLVRFCLIAGCRVGNAVRLEWRDVDFQARVIVLREMKGDEHHAIPMTAQLLVLLANQPRVEGIDRVFTYAFRGGRKRRPFTIAGWKKPWWAALTAAGIPDFRFHDTRHTALSRITRAKGLKAAQKLAGHASITSTARYAHCEMDELREAMEMAEFTHSTPTMPGMTKRK